MQTERHGLEMKQTIQGSECGFLTRAGLQRDLPISLRQVQSRQVPRLTQPVEELVDPGHWIRIKLGDGVHPAEIHTEAGGTVLLRNHYHRTAPLALGRLNDSKLEHVLYLPAHHTPPTFWDPVRPLSHSNTWRSNNSMFNDIRSTGHLRKNIPELLN
ncbi:UNVERIFIED_CONTAM: hypothetical protein FKN15_005554 [Acipenser sinensis]